MPRVRIEFTVEPFSETGPGAHVRAVWQAVEARGCELEVGPFSSEIRLASPDAPDVLADIVRAALGAGATHLSIQLDRVDSGVDAGEEADADL